MRVPVKWLGDFVGGLPEAAELAERLTMSGLEVEAVESPDPRLVDGLVVARILERKPHPNADRLAICEVDDGSEQRQIVCGATNMEAGDHVVLARPGTVLPGGLKIKKSKIRGEASHGMLCAASELGLHGDDQGILIVSGEASPGDSAAELLGLDSCVLEISVTPNRGDCLSMRGMAREIAAVCDLTLSESFHAAFPTPAVGGRIRVSVEVPELCAMYRGVEVRGVRVAPSPPWIAARLSGCGLRPVNNVVDVTNLVLMEYGQPLHAFDADLLVDDQIVVRASGGDGQLELLDGQEAKLAERDVVICDGLGPVALAGVMGGARTAVTEATTNIFLESALFSPAAVRGTSRRLGLISESSYRFERGVDPAGVEQALLRAAELLEEVAAGKAVHAMASAGPGSAQPETISLRTDRVRSVLGVSVEAAEASAILRSLGAEVSQHEGGLSVVPPGQRHDLTREVDLIEEIARIKGYDAIPERVPQVPMLEVETPPLYTLYADLRQRLSAIGLSEIVALAFAAEDVNVACPGLHERDAEAVGLRNPLRSDAREMRRSVLPGLLESASLNLRNGASTVDLFTLARTFAHSGEKLLELDVAGGLLLGPRRTRGPSSQGSPSFWDGKGVVEKIAAVVGGDGDLGWRRCDTRPDFHPRACAVVELGSRVLGYVGMIHPDLADRFEITHETCIFEIDSSELLEYSSPRSGLDAIPRYPASSRDVSLIVPDPLLAGDVVAAVKALAEPLLESVAVFDEYVGEAIDEGKRALAFSIVYRHSERTLTDDEVAALHARVVSHLVAVLGVTVRI